MAPNSGENAASNAAAAREAAKALTNNPSPRVDEHLEQMRRYLAAVTRASDHPQRAGSKAEPERETAQGEAQSGDHGTEPQDDS